MDETIARAIQREAADALLNVGVSVPLKEFRLPFRKKPVRLRVTLHRPYMSGQIRFAKIYLTMDVTAEQMEDFSKEEQMKFLAAHGSKICRMLAIGLCVGFFTRHLVRPAAWLIRNFMEPRYQFAAIRKFVSLMGTDPFIPIIRLAERTNPMKPRLSRDAKGS